MSWLIVLLAIGAGASNPFQAGTNAELNKALGQPMWALLSVYVSGMFGVLVLMACVRPSFPAVSRASQVPWWAWLGGLISIAATVAGLTLAQRLGSGTFTGVSVTAALLVSMLLDNFGLVGFKQHPASPMRLAGGALMIAGLWLVTKF